MVATLPLIPEDICIGDITSVITNVMLSTPAELAQSSNHSRGAQGRCGGGGVEAEMNETQDSRGRERGGAYGQNSTAATFERP